MEQRKVVVVEDDRTLLLALVTELEAAGYQVITVENGRDAVATIGNEMPDIVLLDIILPKRDGFAVLEELKADAQVKHIPVIILTNLAQAEDRETGIKLGAADYFVKSGMAIGDVTAKIAQVLGSS